MNRDLLPSLATIPRHALFFFAALCISSATAMSALTWPDFVKSYVSPDGRVVDTGNGNISHSEGQGYGMLLAAAHHDQPTFDKIWNWTRANLQIRPDALLAWKWEPRGKKGVVTDMNNATDGDILVAWALYRAAALWGSQSYRDSAAKILAAILKSAIVPSSLGPLVLPAVEGFKRPNGVVVNPSYWVFPAFRTFAKEDPSTDWMAVSAAGKKLLGIARFGTWKLPPEWVLVQQSAVQLPDGFAPQFGYNAIRIPMHLVWDRDADPADFASYRAYRASFPSLTAVKATVDLITNKPGNDPILPGMARIYLLVGATGAPGSEFATAGPSLSGNSYFSAALTLLTDLAYKEGVQPPAQP